MAKSLDYQYISRLVVSAQAGEGEAFAELYAATYQKQYAFALWYLEDEYLARDALQKIYVTALRNMAQLKDPDLFLSWLKQISFRICFRMQGEARQGENMARTGMLRLDGREYTIGQVMKLPFTESQVLLLRYFRHMKMGEIANLMELDRGSVRWYLKKGRKRLAGMFEQGGEAKKNGFRR